ncbi:hypothetical protein [Tenuifilum osseticum]|uniref:hypothetical protein n=1 Tax=Tenuifilum osseticum TaxID=3374723 RepID=UPI0034E3F58A
MNTSEYWKIKNAIRGFYDFTGFQCPSVNTANTLLAYALRPFGHILLVTVFANAKKCASPVVPQNDVYFKHWV